MRHILITAGGTVEAIDGVRQIRNTSTGSLCSCIYDALSEYLTANVNVSESGTPEFMVHYVVSEAAVQPELKNNLPVSFYTVSDVKSVESVLENLMTTYSIDYVIHGMAVSDFTKDYLVTRDELIDELSETLKKELDNSPETPTRDKLREVIGDILSRPKCKLDTSLKIGSKAELVLALKRTPKLIEKIKKLNPETFLVGFKLLKGVSEDELIQAAVALSEKNRCDLVLANDMTKIQDGLHEGLLLKGRHVVGRYRTKNEIAKGIAEHIIGDACGASMHE